MAAARWEELLPKWNRAAWGLHQQLAWGNPPNWKMLQQTTAKHSLSVVAINIFFKCFPVFFLSLFCSFCFWLHPDHHAMITLSCISLVCKRMVNYFIFTGILIFPQDYRGSAEGDSKNCMEVSRWWVIFFNYYYFCFVFDESYASFWGRKSIVMWLIEERFCKQQFIAQDAFGNCMVMQTSAPEGKHPVVPSV